MSAILPGSRKSFSAAKKFGKLGPLLIAGVFCSAIALFAVAKTWHKLNAAAPAAVHKTAHFKGKQFAANKPVSKFVQGGAITIDYGSHDFIFHTGKPAGITPTSSGVDTPSPGIYGSPLVLGSGLTFSQNGVALDATGNMYVNDQDGGIGDVKKITADGSSTTTIGSGFSNQSGNVAVDKAGNVYVVDQSVVWKIPVGAAPGTYDTPVVINNTFSRPFAIAADTLGNIYVTDLGVGVYRMANDGNSKVKIDNAIANGSGITVDAAGNVYVCDYVALALYEIPAGGGTETQLATGFGFPRALAVDGMGNIYVCDENDGSIYEVAPGGGSPVAVITGLTNNVGLAVDAAYNLYAGRQGSAGVSKYSPIGGYFISQPLPAGMNFDNTSGIVYGKPTTITAQTSYIISAYNSNGGVSDTLRLSVVAAGASPVVSYSNPNSVALVASISPIAPTATGVGAPGYAPKVPLVVNLANTGGLTYDAAGNIYVALRADNTIKKIPADGSAATNLGTGFASPAGVAVDASGNIYVADYGNGAVVKMSPDGLSTSTIGSGFGSPYAVALDAAGNVYVADQGLEAVFKILASDGSTVQLADNFTLLTGIAVDKTGQNIYVTDAGASSAYKIPAAGGTAVDLGASFSFPFALTMDTRGEIYVADLDFINSVTTLYKGDGHSANFVNTNLTFLAPSGMAIDPSFNLFVADAGTNAVYEASPSGGYFLVDALPKGLALNDTTGVITGTPSKASPATDYHVLAYNAMGSTNVTVNIAVVAPPPPVISYNNPNVDTLGVTIGPIAPTPANSNSPSYADHETVTNAFANPSAPASDAAGNIYVLDRANTLVKKIPADGSSPVAIATGFTFSNPTALTVDGAGNVYVADQGLNAVEKIASDGVTVTQVGDSFSFPVGVAVDGNNNVYVADVLDGAVYKVLASNGSTVTLSGTFDFLSGIAVDKTGQNIYVSDAYANSVYKVSPTCGCPEDLGYNFIHPTGVALDPAGNLYVTDTDLTNATGTLYKGDGITSNFIAISAPFSDPESLVVDPSGDIFVADAGTGTLEKVTPSGGYYLATPLPKGLKLNDTTGVITGKPTVLSAATDYKVIEYNLGGGTQALVNIAVVPPPPPSLSYTTPNSYVAGVAITPLQPTSTNVAAPDYSGSFTIIGSGFNSPRGTAVDKHGNVFVADSLNNRVMMIPAGGGSPVPWGSGFSGPTGVAVDSLGYVYVADYGNQLIKMIAPNGIMITQLAAVTAPTAVAVDANRNVYYTDQSNGLVYKIDISTGTPVALNDSFGLLYPNAIATDGTHVYVSDGYLGAVLKLTNGNSIPDLLGPFNYPTGLAVDAAGTLYISDEGDGVIYRMSLNGHTPDALSTTGLGAPEGLSVDSKGNLYVADVINDQVDMIVPAGGYYIDKAVPAGLSFSSRSGKITGTPTAGSPATDYTATAYNAGGAASAKFSIEVTLPSAPTISYTTPNVYYKGGPIPVLTPSITDNKPIFYSTVPAVVSTGFSLISGIATDKTGNIFVADFGANSVVKVPAGGGTPVTVSSAFDEPQNVAVDAAGNVYVADAGNGAIKKIPHGTGTPVTVATGFAYPVGVAIDASGNIYVADEGDDLADNGVVYKIPAGTNTLINLTGSDPLDPVGVAQDGTGNIFFIDSYNGAAYELVGGAGSPVQVGPLLNSPGTITATNTGDILFSDALLGTIYAVPVGGTDVITINNMGLPFGLAVDGSGNLYTSTPSVDGGTLNKAAPAGGLFISTALPAGLIFNSTTGSISGTPTVLSPATDYTVTTYNLGGSGTGVVNIKVAAPSALLTRLSLSPSVTLTKVTGPDFADYTANVLSQQTSVKVIPVAKDPNATITVNGVAATSGLESAPVALNADTTAIAVTVTSSDGLIKNTYRIVVTRNPSNIALLTTLSLSPSAVLTRVTGTNDADYTATVIHTVTSLKVIPVTKDNSATITVNSLATASGTESDPVTLNADTTAIAVTVTGGDGVTKKQYRIVVTRLPSTNAILSSLALSPKAALTRVTGPDAADYTANVVSQLSEIKVIPTAVDPDATITVNGAAATSGAESSPVTLNTDTTAIAVTVTAADGTTRKTYRIVVTRIPSNIALLSTLALSPRTTLTRVSGPDLADYTATVANATGSVKVIPTAADNNSTITVNGMAATSGAESSPVTLNSDTTAIAVTVTAGDGVTKNTYRIVVTRLPSSNAILSTLALDPRTTLTRVTGPDAADFTANVTSQTTSIKVIPVAADNNATITVNGVPTISGTDSDPVTLNTDTTAIAVTVTAADGVTKNTYRVVVTRHPSGIALLTTLALNPATTLTRVSGPDYADFTATVNNRVGSVKVTPVSKDASATITVNGIVVASGTETGTITLNTDTTTIAATVIAEDGTTKNSYVIVITRLPPPSNVMAYEQPKEMPVESGPVVVHQNVSPNGDGNSDALKIDGITQYPDNKLQIMSRAGNLVFEAKGYDNTNKVFDGHGNDGKLQQAGTYFYSLEYKVGNETKRKTGYIVLKY